MNRAKSCLFAFSAGIFFILQGGSALAQKVTHAPSSITIAEGAVQDISIQLSQPIVCPGGTPCTVNIPFVASDPASVTISPVPLTYDYTQWASTLHLTVTAIHDNVHTGDKSITLSAVVVSEAPYYNNYSVPISITITDIDPITAPVLGTTSAALDAGSAATINVVAGASNSPDPNSLSITIDPIHGSAVVSGQNIVYTPTSGYKGNDQLTYRLCSVFDNSVCATTVLGISVAANRLVPNTGIRPAKNGALLATGVCLGAVGLIMLIRPKRRRN